MEDKERSKSQKDVAHKGKRNLSSLNDGRTKRLEGKVKYHENELRTAKESGNKIAMYNAYENLEAAYKALGLDENAKECRKNKLGLRVLGNVNKRKRKGTLNHGRRERYEGRIKFYEELVKTGNAMEAYKVLSRTYQAMFENEKTLEYHEIESKPEPMWMETSDNHREKFNMLKEYNQKHPDKVKNINGVRVSFREEFCIGSGSDGTMVYIGLAEDGCEKAVKRMVRSISGKLGLNEKEILNTPNAVNSKRVVKYWYYKEQSDEDLAYLILDLHEETLEQYVESAQSQEILTTNYPVIARHILEGLRDLHRKPEPILHRDLKPSNILRNVQGDWLLADFGISRTLSGEKNTHITMESGTTFWRAVESYGWGRYKKESDIQVAGMVLFYILTKGDHPFGPEADRHQNLLDGNPVGLDNLADPVAKDLISWMLQHDPKDRPSADEALKHPHLQNPDQQFELLKCVGNEPEIKKGDNSSDIVWQLNYDLQLLLRTWKSHIPPDVLAYLCSDGRKALKYGDKWTECLRLIRNKSQHWHNQPRPRPKVHYDVGEPREYFLKVFPILPTVVHRVIRSRKDWKERADLENFF